jgi:hypothetical protein
VANKNGKLHLPEIEKLEKLMAKAARSGGQVRVTKAQWKKLEDEKRTLEKAVAEMKAKHETAEKMLAAATAAVQEVKRTGVLPTRH